MPTPKAFSTRNASSGDSGEWAFRTSERIDESAPRIWAVPVDAESQLFYNLGSYEDPWVRRSHLDIDSHRVVYQW